MGHSKNFEEEISGLHAKDKVWWDTAHPPEHTFLHCGTWRWQYLAVEEPVRDKMRDWSRCLPSTSTETRNIQSYNVRSKHTDVRIALTKPKYKVQTLLLKCC
ncbi:hypothetical protein XENORESO_005827 [Xenotaenia resolanae]|uniref:Uncharacterized protein n=1 Tax=Xenotaenia resolanae TaxID=208358 RepID=A0ABV0WP39_9TELE